MSARRTGATAMPNCSGISLAMDFGVTSEKMRMTTVMTMVDHVAPMSPIARTKRTVAMADAPMFTMLLPIRMVDSMAS